MTYDQFYLSSQRKIKRENILKRDKYMCRLCARVGKIKEATIVHHLTPLKEAPELRLDNNNLISVCMACHNKIHNRNYDTLTDYGIEVKRLYERKALNILNL